MGPLITRVMSEVMLVTLRTNTDYMTMGHLFVELLLSSNLKKKPPLTTTSRVYTEGLWVLHRVSSLPHLEGHCTTGPARWYCSPLMQILTQALHSSHQWGCSDSGWNGAKIVFQHTVNICVMTNYVSKMVYLRVFRWLYGFISPDERSLTPTSPRQFMLRSSSFSSTACQSVFLVHPLKSCETEPRTLAKFGQLTPVIPHLETLKGNMRNVVKQWFRHD